MCGSTLTSLSSQPISSVKLFKNFIFIGFTLLLSSSPCKAKSFSSISPSSSFINFKESGLFLTSTFDDILVNPGSNVIISCSASGSPLPQSAYWLFNGKPIDAETDVSFGKPQVRRFPSEVTLTLNLTSIDLNNSGLYSCIFQNDLARVSHSARLNVHGNPIVHDSMVLGPEGSNITLECRYGGYPIHSISWEKGNQQIITDHRRSVDTLKGYLAIKNLIPEDSGSYKCTVFGISNSTAFGYVYLNVGASPTIDEVFLPASRLVEEGTKVNIICFINKGDPEIHFTWFKDDQRLTKSDTLPPNDNNYLIERSNHSSSILFKSVHVSDKGDYTCQATNKYGSDSRKTRLIVQSKPKWRIEPANNINGTLSKRLIINCDADGYPKPNITWLTRSSSSDRFIAVRDGRLKTLENGSLLIDRISDEDETQFMCNANNGIGDGLSKIVNFKVNRPPKITAETSSIEVKRGNEISIRCVGYGDLPITMEWTRSIEKIKSNEPNSKYSMNTTKMKDVDGIISILSINSVERTDEDVYSCVGHNDYGYASVSIRLTVIERPGKPINLEPGNLTSRTIELHWKLPFDGNSIIKQCHIVYEPVDQLDVGSNNNQISYDNYKVTVDGAVSSTLISNLLPLITYTFRVYCENAVGQSDHSDPVNVTTRQEAPEGPPQSIKVSATGSQSLKVTWTPVSPELQHGPILAYYVGYKTESANDRYQFKHHVVNMEEERNSPSFTTYLTNLRPLTRYWVVVQAYNQAGSGPLSDPVVGVTLETSPPISPSITVVGTTNDSIEIVWERDPKDKSIIREYNLYFKEENKNSHNNHIKLEPELRSYVLKDLSCGTKYSLFMTATNSLGTGEPSQKVSARTKGAAPISPTRLSSVIWTNKTEVILNLGLWNNGGCPIHYFDIKKRPKHTNIWIPVHEKLTMKGSKKEIGLHHFVPGMTYIILVIAKNDAGVTQSEYPITIPSHDSTISQSSSRSSYSSAKSRNNELTGAYEEVPLYRNISFIVPISLSLAIIIFLLLLAFYCVNRQPHPIYNHYSDDGKASNSLSLSDLSNQKPGSRLNMSTKCMNIDNAMKAGSIVSGYSTSNHLGTERSYTTHHQYSEPYSTASGIDTRSSLGSKDHFATIKRGASGPRPSPYIAS
ncbi:Down syndrome cell adhesion molecule homolog isoform X2 [Tetranychus urticae]|uniref:MDscam14 n=1 Tax=Tetranychus urticae TaxID=32264 RepID=A0A2Z4EF76_TETUR|nr:Down syndrome cell adhesion molecule homolog isoform X2 [Tetranychus urticae]AWV54574.1 mDscam14 [Tetranychus urticae]